LLAGTWQTWGIYLVWKIDEKVALIIMMTFTYWRIVIFGTDSNMKSSKQENYNADFKIQDFIFTC
jgi:hypothetical protein